MIRADANQAIFGDWREQVFDDQNRQMPLDARPQKHLPQWGRWFETPQLIAMFLPACELQANLIAPFDLITTRFEIGEGVAAFNSDQLKDYRAEPGGFDVIPKHSTYRSIETMGGPSIILAFKQLSESLVAHQLDQTPALTSGQIRPTDKGLAIASEIRSLFNQHSRDAFHLESLAALALGHIVHLSSSGKNDRFKRLPDRLQPEQLSTVLAFIRSNLAGRLCLEQLANTIGLNAHYFARAFKATTGIPPHQYILHCRVAYARDLLSNTRYSLADIAYHAGFGSQSHMTAVFSRVLQITPFRYRQKVLADQRFPNRPFP